MLDVDPSALHFRTSWHARVNLPLQRLGLASPAFGPFGTECNSHEVLCLLSTCDDLDAGSRRPPASPPAGFGYPLGSGVRPRSYSPDMRTRALSRFTSPEVFPFTERSPFLVPYPLAVSHERPVRGPPNKGRTRRRLQGFDPGEDPSIVASSSKLPVETRWSNRFPSLERGKTTSILS